MTCCAGRRAEASTAGNFRHITSCRCWIPSLPPRLRSTPPDTGCQHNRRHISCSRSLCCGCPPSIDSFECRTEPDESFPLQSHDVCWSCDSRPLPACKTPLSVLFRPRLPPATVHSRTGRRQQQLSSISFIDPCVALAVDVGFGLVGVRMPRPGQNSPFESMTRRPGRTLTTHLLSFGIPHDFPT